VVETVYVVVVVVVVVATTLTTTVHNNVLPTIIPFPLPPTSLLQLEETYKQELDQALTSFHHHTHYLLQHNSDVMELWIQAA